MSATSNPNGFPARWQPFPLATLFARTARLEDLFDAWVSAAFEARLALDAWLASPSGERADAHAVYRAALEREECAAGVLAAAVA